MNHFGMPKAAVSLMTARILTLIPAHIKEIFLQVTIMAVFAATVTILLRLKTVFSIHMMALIGLKTSFITNRGA